MKTFCHAPWVPDEMSAILDVAYDLWWSSDHEAYGLFESMSPGLWRDVKRNPIALLRRLSRDELTRLAADDAFRARLAAVHDRQRAHVEKVGGRHAAMRHGALDLDLEDPVAAYFSAEFGLHESLPIYSGGLGVLAGDHVRSAGDLGAPLIGIGLLYRLGYFQQSFSLDDWQQETSIPQGFHDLPLTLIEHDDGSPVTVTIHFPERDLKVRLWIARVGRSRLLLLDSFLSENWFEDRDVTARLYDSDRKIRLKQEIVLGVGGVLALQKLGIAPGRFHMNEGHSAFLVLERAAQVIKERDCTFDEALEATRPTNVFTTHTPVAAGHEVFRRELMDPFVVPQLHRIRITPERFYELGRRPDAPNTGEFELTSLAIRFSGRINAVSKLHGEVSREKWNCMWPERGTDDVPIAHVTNGIHVPTWIGPEMSRLFENSLRPDWLDAIEDPAMWAKLDDVPDSELWATRCAQRERLVHAALRRAQDQLVTRNVDRRHLLENITALDPNALTIGFARRFATYKRATLLFRHIERLAALFRDSSRKVQIILAGKAHPADDGGKHLLQEVHRIARREEFSGRVLLLENYDMALGRLLVQGSDVWLNTPRPPKEASGTSGMKACPNGALTLSTLDGWWVEAEGQGHGWTIGRGHDANMSEAAADEEDAAHLIDLLETEVVPLFWNRDENGIPVDWLRQVRASIGKVTPFFNTSRMVRDYVERFYR